MGAARAGPENRGRPQGGRQRDSPRLPSRSTAKTRRRLSMVRSRLGVATAAAPKRFPGVPKSLAAPKQLSPPFPAQLGEALGHSPKGAGRSRLGRGAARRRRALTPAASVPRLPTPAVSSPFEDARGLASRGRTPWGHTPPPPLLLPAAFLLQLGTC